MSEAAAPDDAIALTEAFRGGARSAVEITEAALEAAERDRLGSFWHLLAERALQRAAGLDERRAKGHLTAPLAAVPFAAKDCFDVAAVETSCGIAGDPPFPVPTVDAGAIALLEAAGAILVAKASMDQLAWGMKGDPPGFPPIRNPADPTRMAGGSSGGSAAAVGSGVVPFALGTDAGGSVRQPAGWCGVVGFKPTLGAITKAGCAPMAPSLDTVGALTRTLADQQLVAGVLCSTTSAESQTHERPRVGIVEASFSDTDPAIAQACDEALRRWEAAGATLVELDLPWPRRGLGKIYAAELAASWTDVVDPDDGRLLATVRAGLQHGAGVDAVSYLRAAQALEEVRREAVAVMGDVDVVVGPTSPIVAPPLDDPDPTAIAGRNTRVFNGLGWPALSLPLHADGLPIGLQLAARPGEDVRVLALAQALADVIER
ncbi:MAG: amidase [Gaiellaceae bacterium]